MYKIILVPLDRSKRAEAILPHVKEMAKKYQSEIIIMTVDDDPIILDRDEIIDISEYKKRQEQINQYLHDKKNELMKENLKIRIIVDSGSVVKAVLKAADDENVDMIALASHGLSSSGRSSFGSVSAGILQRTRTPLFIIKSNEIG